MTELKLIAKNCSYSDLEEQLIRDRIVCGASLDVVRQHLLRTDDLVPDKAVKICRADEQSKKHAQYLAEEVNESVNGLRIKQTRGSGKEAIQVPRFNELTEYCQNVDSNKPGSNALHTADNV